MLHLCLWILRKVLGHSVPVQSFEIGHNRDEVFGRKIRILLRARLGLVLLQDRLEGPSVDVFHDPTEHRDEPTVCVPGEPGVGDARERFHGRVVQAQIENRIHHPRHRELRAGPDGDDQRVCRIPKPPADPRLDGREPFLHLLPEAGREPALPRIRVAGFRRDREAGRDWEAKPRHLGEPGAFTAKQVPHGGVPLFEQVDVLRQARTPIAVVSSVI